MGFSVWEICQTDFTDWISFLPSDLREEISPYPEGLSKITKNLSSAWNSGKDNNLDTYGLTKPAL